MSLTIDGQANSIASSTGGVNIPATVGTLSVGPSGSYMNVTSSGTNIGPNGSYITANSSGIGIGTNNPQTSLHLKTNGGAIALIESNTNYDGNIRVKNTGAYYTIGMLASPGSTSLSFYDNNAGASRMSIDTSGRVTMPYQPAFFASGNQGAITVAVGSYFPFNTLNTTFANNNRNNGYSTSTYLYTAPVTGLYQFYIQIYLNTASNTTSMTWWKNGSQLSYEDAAINIFMSTNSSTTPTSITMNGSVILELSANDTIGIKPRTGNPNGINLYAGHSSFWGYLIG